jgi:hypothetical protein
MKLIRNIYLLIAIAIQTSNSFAMQNIAIKAAKIGISGACSLIELFVTSTPLLVATVFHPAKEEAKKLQNSQSNAPKIVTDFITNIAQDRKINDLKVILYDDYDYCAMHDRAKILYVPTYLSKKLESLLQNSNRSIEEEQQFNEYIGTIHHELTHSINESSVYSSFYDTAMETAGALTVSAALTSAVKKYVPIIHKNFALRNSFKLVRSGLTLYTTLNIMNMNMYKKYDELKADDGIPNKKELLTAQIAKYESKHNDYVKYIDIIKERADYPTILWKKLPDEEPFNRKQLLAMKLLPKSLFNKPLIMDIVFHAKETHPSDLRRTNRFKDRIAKL